MAEIKLYDYESVDDWGWGESFVIGQGNLSASVVVGLIEAVPEGEEITVKINSCGGYVFDGWAIYNALKAHKGNIVVRIDGLAASIASIIAMAGDTIIVCQASLLMIHKPTIDPFWYGSMDAEDLKKEAAALDQIQAVLNSIYKSKTNLDSVVIDSMINAETWITPQEAVTLGFANSIEQTITETTLAENTFKHIFKNANALTMAYANKTIKVNKSQNNMSNLNEALKENTSLLTEVKNLFKKLIPKNETETPEVVNSSVQLEDDSYVYFEGELAVGTKVYTDEAMTVAAMDGDHTLMDGRTITVAEGAVTNIQDVVEDNATTDEALVAENTALKEELASLKVEVTNLSNAVKASNELLAQVKNIKSTYEPAPRNQEITKVTTVTNDGKPDLSKEAKEEAKKRYNKNK